MRKRLDYLNLLFIYYLSAKMLDRLIRKWFKPVKPIKATIKEHPMKIPAEYLVAIKLAPSRTLMLVVLRLSGCGTRVKALRAIIDASFGRSSSPRTVAMIDSIYTTIHNELYERSMRGELPIQSPTRGMSFPSAI